MGDANNGQTAQRHNTSERFKAEIVPNECHTLYNLNITFIPQKEEEKTESIKNKYFHIIVILRTVCMNIANCVIKPSGKIQNTDKMQT